MYDINPNACLVDYYACLIYYYSVRRKIDYVEFNLERNEENITLLLLLVAKN